METIFQHLEMADRQRGNLRIIWEMAVTEERNRLAREIHDSLVQAFAGIVLHTEALGSSLGANNLRSRRALSQIQQLARSGLDEARRSVRALRPKMLEGRTLTEALEEAAEHLCEAGLFCSLIQRGTVFKLSEEVQTELFRIAQEAMTNICKHAQAKAAWIILEFAARQVMLTVWDDGVGLAATNPAKRGHGYGLATMRERAHRIGGALEIESPASGGSLIRVRVPWAENGENVNYVKPYETVKN
jgi:two-component system, NarL family, sensor kinase